MPSIEHHLHLVLSKLENGTYRVSVPFYPALCYYGTYTQSIKGSLVNRARTILQELPLELVASRQAAGTPEVRPIRFSVNPPSRQPAWREPVVLQFLAVCWEHGEMGVACVPELDIEVVAKRSRDLDRLLQKEIQFALQRLGLNKSLPDLMWIQRSEDVRIVNATLSAEIKTPKQLAHEEQIQTKPLVLKKIATSLTNRNRDAIFGMDGVVLEMAERLTAHKPQSLLLVGPSGVGKTAAIGALVASRKDVNLGNHPFWSTSGARIVAGMLGFGAWQERCEALCEEAAETGAIIHFGNLMELMMVGRHEGQQQGIADFLRPSIDRGELHAIVECTPEQLTRIETEAPNLLEVFTRIEIQEPTGDAGRSILRQAADQATGGNRETEGQSGNGRERKPLSDEVIATLDRLHRRYATLSAYPGRPLRFLGNLVKDIPSEEPITPSVVTRTFSKETGLPRFLLDDATALDLDATQAWFNQRVIGQPCATEAVVNLLAAVKAILTRPGRPIASLLFVGYTGVGKTEMAKALAQFLYHDRSRMTRIDMSEYADPGAVDRLIGGTFGSEGVLTSAVREQPFGVVLLDEFEGSSWNLVANSRRQDHIKENE